MLRRFSAQRKGDHVSNPGCGHLTNILNLLKQKGGVPFPGGKRMEIKNLGVLNLG